MIKYIYVALLNQGVCFREMIKKQLKEMEKKSKAKQNWKKVWQAMNKGLLLGGLGEAVLYYGKGCEDDSSCNLIWIRFDLKMYSEDLLFFFFPFPRCECKQKKKN